MHSHEWRPARQRLHTWLTTYVGPGVADMGPAVGLRHLGAVVSGTYGTGGIAYGDGVHLAGGVGIAKG